MEADDAFTLQSAIAQRTRWRIIKLLSPYGSMTAGCIADVLEVTITNLSMHLAVLARTGLVSSKRVGRHIHYELNRERLVEAGEALRRLAGGGGGGDAT